MISLAVHIWGYGWLPTVPWPIAVVAWPLVALVVGVAVAGVIRRRDRQVPSESVAARPEQPGPITSRGDLS